ncbi:alpha,alpha-trehalose-phosphate synthase (UDP-forming) [Pseudoxanthomonas beigongshangi]
MNIDSRSRSTRGDCADTGRIVLVSNRVALPGETQTGGLAVALAAAMDDGPALWLGWSGRIASDARLPLETMRAGRLEYALLDLPADDFEAYYHGFANRVLWPLFHYRIDLVDYHREQHEAWLRVNRRFAEALAGQLRADDTVWIHDYHLIPLARCLRELRVGNRIGFFLHIPMPPPDVLCALPAHRDLLGALACYDLAGFQTRADLDNYRHALRQQGIASHGRSGAFPIGIDVEAVAAQARSGEAERAEHELRASLSGRRLAIGVDRLDYSKGLPERFRAFERHLESGASSAGQLTYLQIAPPSRTRVPEYQDVRRELEGLAGHINGRHAKPEWTPIRYVNDSFPQPVLAGFHRAAAIGLVTPLRDGMNLVAKEYLAAQSPRDPGVLVLSRFAGAAEELAEALIVNPHDLDAVAEAIDAAAGMPLRERQDRWQALMARLRGNDVGHWARHFLDTLRAEPPRCGGGAITTALPGPHAGALAGVSLR